MSAEEAIYVLTLALMIPHDKKQQPFYDAIQLGLEALIEKGHADNGEHPLL